jgi:hypothetical protein
MPDKRHTWTDKDNELLLSTAKQVRSLGHNLPAGAFWAWVAELTKLGITGGSAKERYGILTGSRSAQQGVRSAVSSSEDKKEAGNGKLKQRRVNRHPQHHWTEADNKALLSHIEAGFKALAKGRIRVRIMSFWKTIVINLGFNVSPESPKKQYQKLKTAGDTVYFNLVFSIAAAVEAEKNYHKVVKGQPLTMADAKEQCTDQPPGLPDEDNQLSLLPDTPVNFEQTVVQRLDRIAEFSSEIVGLLIKIVDDRAS